MTGKPLGKIITFYSYKGGTGRTMALANTAWVLASNGRRVLVVDWDLEAPGLHRYFHPFLVDKESTASEGVIDFLINFENEALSLTPKAGGADWYRAHADILRYAVSLRCEEPFGGGGALDFISAGQQDASYTSRVNSFNFANFYGRLGGAHFIEAAKERMREEYDYILIDSRTGVGDTSGICTVQMPDTLVVCFTLNHQSIGGASAVAASVYAQRRKAGRDIRIFPVPTRVDLGEKEKLDRMKEYAKKSFELFPAHVPHERRDAYWGEIQVFYVPYYAYEEILAPFGDKRDEITSVLASVERLTAHLTEGFEGEAAVSKVVPPSEEARKAALAAYARVAAKAEPAEGQAESAERRLIREADKALDLIPPEELDAARRVLTRLVRLSPPRELGSDTRLKVKLSELGDAARTVVEQLKDQRLVLQGEDEATKEATAELADDVFVQSWPRMKEWLTQDRDFLYWRQSLHTDIEKREGGRGPLLDGDALRESRRWLDSRRADLNGREREFIEQSVKAEELSIQEEEERRLQGIQEEEELRQRIRRRRTIRAAAAAALVLASVVGYLLTFHREATLTALNIWPSRYTGEWGDDFIRRADDRLGDRWDYPEGQWEVVGRWDEHMEEDDGTLHLKGAGIGLYKGLEGGKALYDFKANFDVRFDQNAGAGFVLRAQPDKSSGYVFSLKKADRQDVNQGNPPLVLDGMVVRGGARSPLESIIKGEAIPPDCCEDQDTLHVTVQASGYDFRFWVTIDGDNPDRESVGRKFVLGVYHDAGAAFRYGTVGLFNPTPGGGLWVGAVKGTGVAEGYFDGPMGGDENVQKGFENNVDGWAPGVLYALRPVAHGGGTNRHFARVGRDSFD